MKSLRQIAVESTTLAKIMTNRDKMTTEEIMKNFPDGFTIDEVEYVTMQKGNEVDEFWCFHIKGTKNFGFGGTILSNIFDKMLKEFEGDMTALSQAFAEEGLTLRFEEGRTKGTNQRIIIPKIF